MSNIKAAALLGLGHDSVRLIPVDEAFRTRIDLLRERIQRDFDADLKLIAVIASEARQLPLSPDFDALLPSIHVPPRNLE